MNGYQLGDKIENSDLDIVIGSFEIHDYCLSCKTSIEGRAYIRDGLLAKVVEFDEKRKEVLIGEYKPGKK